MWFKEFGHQKERYEGGGKESINLIRLQTRENEILYFVLCLVDGENRRKALHLE